jgi:hypothetical protein
MQSATLTLTLADYDALKNARTTAENEAADLRRQLKEARTADPLGKLTDLNKFTRDCMTVARFAVANLPPETIRGWPYEALQNLAHNIHVLPDFSTNDRDMALDLLAFARDAEELEKRRKATAMVPTKFTAEELEERRRRLEQDPIAQGLIAKMQGTNV